MCVCCRVLTCLGSIGLCSHVSALIRVHTDGLGDGIRNYLHRYKYGTVQAGRLFGPGFVGIVSARGRAAYVTIGMDGRVGAVAVVIPLGKYMYIYSSVFCFLSR